MSYLLPEVIGGLLASIFIYFTLGNEVNLGANAPNYANFPIYVIIAIEILASSLLMLVILIVVYTKGLKKFSGIAIGGIVGLDIFLFGLISGASMNPAVLWHLLLCLVIILIYGFILLHRLLELQ